MAMELKVADPHCGSPLESFSIDTLIDMIVKYPGKVRVLGDFGDRVNIDKPKKNPKAYPELRAKCLRVVEETRKKGTVVLGNHDPQDMGVLNYELYQTEGGLWVLSLHSDREHWGLERSDKFRAKEPGGGWFKEHILIEVLEHARCMIDAGPNDNFRKAVKALKDEYLAKGIKIDVIEYGHRHPKELMINWIEEILCIGYPRGAAEYDTDAIYNRAKKVA